MAKHLPIRGAERRTSRVPPDSWQRDNVVISEEVEIPSWVVDHDSFRQWALSPAYPERGKVSFFQGDIWVDVAMEKALHNTLKMAVATTLLAIASSARLGRFFGDRMMLVNADAGLSTEPDGLFYLYKSLASGRVILKEGDDSLEVEGSPDMVLECISKSSVRKDTVILPQLYWAANIPEYWLVDTRPKLATLTIFRYGADAYQPVRKSGGWQKSTVFNLSFRLRLEESEDNLSDYFLDSK